MNNIGSYEIIGELGRGGMATVFKAYHRTLDRFVAIKMIHQAQTSDTSFRIRFKREAQIVARLTHPHIVPVYDYSEFDGDPYLVMRFIEGASLRTILADGPIEVADILTIMRSIASAIDYAHSQRVLHRDIKPSNILLDMQGTPYLSDFGLARFEQQGASTVSADMVLGTPYYIAPEQALGNEEIDHRADIYSFGVVLYELLVGKVPYSEGSPISIIHDHVYRDLPLPSTVNPNIPKSVEAVLLRALAKDPDSRYDTAAAIMEQLTLALAGTDLVLLHDEARHTASESLAKPRPALSSAALRARQANPVEAQPKTVNRSILIGVIAAIVVITGILWFALQAVSNRQPPATVINPIADSSVVLPLADAQANLAQNPNNPAAYLTLLRALLSSPDIGPAITTFTNGLAIASNPSAYTLEAVQIVTEGRRAEAAFKLYEIGADYVAGTEFERDYRLAVGQRFYAVVDTNPVLDERFSSRMVQDVARPITPAPAPLGLAMYARLFTLIGNYDLAAETLDRALAGAPDLAEAHLVAGELYAAQSDLAAATTEWQLVLDSADAPEWVHLRAEELLRPTT